jgi:hypothetical protein
MPPEYEGPSYYQLLRTKTDLIQKGLLSRRSGVCSQGANEILIYEIWIVITIAITMNCITLILIVFILILLAPSMAFPLLGRGTIGKIGGAHEQFVCINE